MTLSFQELLESMKQYRKRTSEFYDLLFHPAYTIGQIAEPANSLRTREVSSVIVLILVSCMSHLIWYGKV